MSADIENLPYLPASPTLTSDSAIPSAPPTHHPPVPQPPPSTLIRIGKHMVRELSQLGPTAYATHDALMANLLQLARKYHMSVNKRWLSQAYQELSASDPTSYPQASSLQFALMKRAVRSASGIVNVSVVMPPDTFSCKYNCKFCPNEPDMPRSYLSNEDAIKRASSVHFIAAEQVWVRFRALELNGHPIDKIEFRILGGTFSCYEHPVADAFIRDLYYAANTYYDPVPRREPLPLQKEQELNTVATIHVVGLGVETRPDEIKLAEIVRFRTYGVTRVEIGVQHTDDALLRTVNRGHGVKQSRNAIRLLKEYGFKVEIHIMTDLPGATPEGDKECYRQVLQADPDLTPDYMKDYPCLDVTFTEIKDWKHSGRWTPYAERDGGALLRDVLVYRQAITPPYVRVNRIQRDFAEAMDSNEHLGFTSATHMTNLAQIVKRDAEREGIYCQCIRCSEIRNETFDLSEITYNTLQFTASGAEEYFISATVPRPHHNMLLGFIRLRLCVSHDIPPDSARYHPHPMEELRGKTAMIRELHVYGSVRHVAQETHTAGGNSAQHQGIGKNLLNMAESIARTNNYAKMAIISGIGVRDYYRKRGYQLKGTYMVKDLLPQTQIKTISITPTPLELASILFLALLYIGLLTIYPLLRLSKYTSFAL